MKKAFTLLETILAITIIGLAITAAAELTQSSLRIGKSSINQFIAFHLAEEGIEMTRNLRDTNWLQNKTWDTGLSDGLYVLNERILQNIPNKESAPELILSENEKFKRIIEINADEEKKLMRVTSAVNYSENGKERKISLETELTDWKKGPL